MQLDGVSVWRWHEPSRSRRPILHDVDWTVRPGEQWALLGPNGAGKTTLLTLAAAVEFPSAGTIDVLGRRLGRTDVFALRERIGVVDARLARRFAPHLTVLEAVLTGATGTVGSFPERISPAGRERAAALLETLGIGALAGRELRVCSHGERTRALIARALVPRPRLLLLDEPGSGLDLAGRETLLSALARLGADEPGLALVAATHHLEELPATTSHALLLREGRAVACGPVATTLTDELLGACFDLRVRVRRERGRWSATAAAGSGRG